MDRPIDRNTRRRQIAKRALVPALAIVVVAGSLVWLRSWIRPSVARSKVLIAKVERGPVEASISASGTVEPEFEELLTSPIDSRVLEVLVRPGDVVAKGQPILRLDVGETMGALGKVNDQIALKKNQQEKLKLDLENQLIALRSQQEANRLDLEFLRAKKDHSEKLSSEGLISVEDVLQSRLAVDKAAVGVQQIEDTGRNARLSLRTQLEGLVLEMAILERERDEIARRLELATAKADRSGVLTWVVPQEGASVRKGDAIAKIANLTSFRVRATLSDVHANKLSVGQIVRVKVEGAGADGARGASLSGRIASVLPTIQDGIVTVLIGLDERGHPALKSNMRVDVDVVAGSKADALRLRKGPGVSGSGRQQLFVVRGGRAVKTPVSLGMAGAGAFEIVDGLNPGDEVIVSDMRDYESLKEVVLR